DPRLPDDDRAQLRRGAASRRLPAAHGDASGGHASQLEAGRRRDHCRLRPERRGPQDLRRLEGAEAVHSDRPAARLRTPAASRPPGVMQQPTRPDNTPPAAATQAASPRRADVVAGYDLGVEPYEDLWSPVILPAGAELVPWLGLEPDSVVVDVGAGTGALL